jgi:hypothetical protein
MLRSKFDQIRLASDVDEMQSRLIAAICSDAAIEEVVLSKTYGNTRPAFVVITSPRRAFLQFLHHNHAQSPLAVLGSPHFHAKALHFHECSISKKYLRKMKFAFLDISIACYVLMLHLDVFLMPRTHLFIFY